jgi:hypothetical protein
VYEKLIAAKPDNDQGAFYRDFGELDRAEAAHKEALDRWQRLAAKHPDEPRYQ